MLFLNRIARDREGEVRGLCGVQIQFYVTVTSEFIFHLTAI